MDSGVQEVLLGQFVAMLGEELHCEEPEQFETHWDGGGKRGVGKVIQVGLVGKPCDIRVTLFFDGSEVVKTGVLVKYKGESIINEVRLGDALGYLEKHRRIDVLGYLRAMYGTGGPTAGGEGGESEGGDMFVIAEDQDSEELMMRAVMQLTGRTEDDLRAIWHGLLRTNHKRNFKEQVPPFVKIWLRKERGRLDSLFLEEAGILRPRAEGTEVAGGTSAEAGKMLTWVVKGTRSERKYAVETVRMSGAEIKAKALGVEAEWWNGMFWGMQVGKLVRLPEEVNEVERTVRGLSSHAHFDVEKISVNGRLLYWVIVEGRARTMVWRAEVAEDVDVLEVLPEPAVVKEKGKGLGKLMGMLGMKGKEAEVPMEMGEEVVAPQEGTAAEQFHLAHGARLYKRALLGKSADLKEQRGRYIGLLYESDATRFYANPAELTLEMRRTVEEALGATDAARREMKVVEEELRLFFGG